MGAGKLGASALLDPLHFDVAKMRLAIRIGIQIVYSRRRLSSKTLTWLTEPFIHNPTDLWRVHAVQPQALERAPLGREVVPSHASDNLD
jgi:hypothetical protein